MSTHPVVAGAIAGTVHHFFIQYPNQVKLFSTLYALAFINAIFVMNLWRAKDPMRRNRISQMSMDFVIFNTVYV
jgi:hypothetical protein